MLVDDPLNNDAIPPRIGGDGQHRITMSSSLFAFCKCGRLFQPPKISTIDFSISHLVYSLYVIRHTAFDRRRRHATLSSCCCRLSLSFMLFRSFFAVSDRIKMLLVTPPTPPPSTDRRIWIDFLTLSLPFLLRFDRWRPAARLKKRRMIIIVLKLWRLVPSRDGTEEECYTGHWRANKMR